MKRYLMRGISNSGADVRWVARAIPDFTGAQYPGTDIPISQAAIEGEWETGIRGVGMTIDLVRDLGYEPAKTYAQMIANPRQFDVGPYFDKAKDLIMEWRTGSAIGVQPAAKIKLPTGHIYMERPFLWRYEGLYIEGEGPGNTYAFPSFFGPAFHFGPQVTGQTFPLGPAILNGSTQSLDLQSGLHGNRLPLTLNSGLSFNNRQTYTVEFFLRFHTDDNNTRFIWSSRGSMYTGQETDSMRIFQSLGAVRRVNFHQRVGSSGLATTIHGTTLNLNQTYHVVCCFYNGNTVNVAIDGVWGAAGSAGAAGTGSKVNWWENNTIGNAITWYPDTGTPGTGPLAYISSIRVSYTTRYNTGANFTPPTARLPWDGSTALLIDFEPAPASAWGGGASGGYGVVGNDYIKARTPEGPLWLYNPGTGGGGTKSYTGMRDLHIKGAGASSGGTTCLLTNACAHSNWENIIMGGGRFGAYFTDGGWDSYFKGIQQGLLTEVGMSMVGSTSIWEMHSCWFAGRTYVIADAGGSLYNCAGDSPGFALPYMFRAQQYDACFIADNCGIGSEVGPAAATIDSYACLMGSASFSSQMRLTGCSFGNANGFTGPAVRIVDPGAGSMVCKVDLDQCNYVASGLTNFLKYSGNSLPRDGQIVAEINSVMLRASATATWTDGTANQIGHARVRGGRSDGTTLAQFVYQGTADISGANTNVAVTGLPALGDAAYVVDISVENQAGAPAAGSHAWWISGKGTTGFTINCEVAPGVGNTVRFYWGIRYYTDIV